MNKLDLNAFKEQKINQEEMLEINGGGSAGDKALGILGAIATGLVVTAATISLVTPAAPITVAILGTLGGALAPGVAIASLAKAFSK